VRTLIEAGAQVRHLTGQRRSALHWAAGAGHADIVGLLLANGADLETTDECGWSPVIPAILNGHESIAVQLLEAGADPELVCGGRSITQWALRYRRQDLIAYLHRRSRR
jgi:hypothetical protein